MFHYDLFLFNSTSVEELKIIESKTEKRIQEVVTVTKTTSTLVTLDGTVTNATQRKFFFLFSQRYLVLTHFFLVISTNDLSTISERATSIQKDSEVVQNSTSLTTSSSSTIETEVNFNNFRALGF